MPSAAQPTAVCVKAPAKLNLYLQAGLRREDGYHDITTAYQAISLFDILEISLSSTSNGLELSVHGIDSDRIPKDSTNLVIRAASLLSQHADVKHSAGTQFRLFKAIPVEAGLGGGSADAAAALVGCNVLWNVNLEMEELMEIAAQVGEDVPFFLGGIMAIGNGHKQPLRWMKACEHTWHWVLGILPERLSTPAVFDSFDVVSLYKPGERFDEEQYQERRRRCITVPWESATPEYLAGADALTNDLENAAARLLPCLKDALNAGRAAGALASLMTGTGSTCAFLARDGSHAKDLAAGLHKKGIFEYLVVSHGPVLGVEFS